MKKTSVNIEDLNALECYKNALENNDNSKKIYYENNMEAFKALTLIANLKKDGEYYANNWKYIYKLKNNIYSIEQENEGWCINIYQKT